MRYICEDDEAYECVWGDDGGPRARGQHPGDSTISLSCWGS